MLLHIIKIIKLIFLVFILSPKILFPFFPKKCKKAEINKLFIKIIFTDLIILNIYIYFPNIRKRCIFYHKIQPLSDFYFLI